MRLNSTLNPTVASELPFLGISFFRDMVLWAPLAPRGPYGAPLQGDMECRRTGQTWSTEAGASSPAVPLSGWLGLAGLVWLWVWLALPRISAGFRLGFGFGLIWLDSGLV